VTGHCRVQPGSLYDAPAVKAVTMAPSHPRTMAGVVAKRERDSGSLRCSVVTSSIDIDCCVNPR
jgi:hypothetical protein